MPALSPEHTHLTGLLGQLQKLVLAASYLNPLFSPTSRARPTQGRCLQVFADEILTGSGSLALGTMVLSPEAMEWAEDAGPLPPGPQPLCVSLPMQCGGQGVLSLDRV